MKFCETCAVPTGRYVFCTAHEPPLTLKEELQLLTADEWRSRHPYLPRQRWLALFKE